MHTVSINFHDENQNIAIDFPAGESLNFEFQNAPNFGERVLTIGENMDDVPLVESVGIESIRVSDDMLRNIPEGILCRYNLWQRDGGRLNLIAEGRLVRRSSLAPASETTRLVAGPRGPLLFIDGDSVMQNIPGTRVFLEQLVGHKYRFSEGYLGAIGGDSARAIFESVPEILPKINRGNSVVLVGPIGANQTAQDDEFEEIITYLDAIFASYLSAGAKIVAVPTLLDGQGVTAQDDKKIALANWVNAYGDGGMVEYLGRIYSVPAHEHFFPVPVTNFDRDAMKSDVSHPNASGARYLAEEISGVLLSLVDQDVFADENALNLLGESGAFGGSRAASATGVTGTIPLNWNVNRTEGTSDWSCGYDTDGCFEVSVMDAATDSTLAVTLPDVSVDVVAGDIVNFIAEIELRSGATGMRTIGVSGQGSSIMTLDPDWAISPGVYNIRTRDEAYADSQSTQSFQVLIRVTAGATATIKLRRSMAFHVENQPVDDLVIPSTGEFGWNTDLNSGTPLQLNYSQGDRTVTASASIIGLRHVRGATAYNGKSYFEFHVGADVLGVGLGTNDVTALSGGAFGTGRCFWSGSLFFHSSGNHAMGAALNENDVVQMAVDVDLKAIWVRKNNSGDWNNDPLADPSAGLGGLLIDGMIGDIYAYAGVQPVAGASVTLNEDSTTQSFSAPTGFGASA
ncbi:MAG: hypothetical protein JXQ85_00155 [Cognatishimia sp.]|uniref:hypothetical protein n=1 Tax=Cognatishimia sp. TaxID=2211648 RepID=UPI003B8B303C